MSPVVPVIHAFEGAPLLTLSWKGRPAWIARQVGARLGYTDGGKRLPSKILAEWSGEFIVNRDYVLITDVDLAALHQALEEAGLPRVGRGSLCLLFESGFHLVLAKTDLPVGRRLRRFLVDEVLPQLARTGRYEPAPKAQPEVPLAELRLDLRSLSERREARLLLQARTRARWVDLCDRRFRTDALYRVITVAGAVVPPEYRFALELVAAEVATGLGIGDALIGGDDAPPANAAPNAPAPV